MSIYGTALIQQGWQLLLCDLVFFRIPLERLDVTKESTCRHRFVHKPTKHEKNRFLPFCINLVASIMCVLSVIYDACACINELSSTHLYFESDQRMGSNVDYEYEDQGSIDGNLKCSPLQRSFDGSCDQLLSLFLLSPMVDNMAE